MSRLIAILMLAATSALAQQPATPAPTPGQAPGQAPPAARPPQGPQRPQVQSPVVEGDKATFAIYAPKATEVKLSSGEIDCLVPGPNKAFTKGENGVWTIRLGRCAPGIYDYVVRCRRRHHGRPGEHERVRQRSRLARLRRGARRGRTAAARRVAPTCLTAAVTAALGLRFEGDGKRVAASTSTRRRVTTTRVRRHAATRCSCCCTAPATTTLTGLHIGRANVIADNLIAAQRGPADDHRDARRSSLPGTAG